MRHKPIRRLILCATLLVCALSNPEARSRVDDEVYLYADLWTDISHEEVRDYVNVDATATVELGNCCPGCPDAEVEDDLIGDNNILDTSSTTGICTAQVYTYHSYQYDTAIDGDFYSRGRTPPANCADSQTTRIRTFRSVYEYSHYNALHNVHQWNRNITICNGVCQAARICTPDRLFSATWLTVEGIVAGVNVQGVITFYACQPRGVPFQSTIQLTCKMPFGTNLTGDNCPQ